MFLSAADDALCEGRCAPAHVEVSVDLSFFQIMMVLSFLLTLAAVIRLHRGTRILNARVTILSHLVRDLRGGERAAGTQGVDDAKDAPCELERAEEKLQSEMGRDFAPAGADRNTIRKARDLRPRRAVTKGRRPTPAPLDHLPAASGLAAAREQVVALEAELQRAQKEREILARHNLQLQEESRENSAVSALLQDLETSG
jgi:hypothetical protein